MEIVKYKYEILDFGESAVFTAENDDVAAEEGVLHEGAAEEESQEIAEEAKEPEAEVVEELPPEPTFSMEEMEVAKSLAKEGGIREGQEAAKKEAEESGAKVNERISVLLEAINNQVAKSIKTSQESFVDIEKSYNELALSVAKKVIGENQALGLQDEIKSIIQDTFEKIGNKESVKLFLNPETAKLLKGKIADVDLEEDETILPNDFKIEWQNGFAQRKTDEIWKDIEQIIKTGEVAPSDIEGEKQIIEEPVAEVAQEEVVAKDITTEKPEETSEEIIEDNNESNENNNEE